jgi:hypothetical protein
MCSGLGRSGSGLHNRLTPYLDWSGPDFLDALRALSGGRQLIPSFEPAAQITTIRQKGVFWRNSLAKKSCEIVVQIGHLG